MKKLFNRLTATFTSALLAVGVLGSMPVSAKTETEEVTIHFDLSGDGVKVEDNQYGNPQYIVDFSGVPGTSRYLSDVGLERSGYTFMGWTFDGVQAYSPGSVIQFPETDATLTPVWSKKSDSRKFNIHYEAVCDLGTFDKEGRLPDYELKPGELVEIPLDVFYHPTHSYTQIGWVYDGKTYLGQQKIIMPEHDIELTPSWHKYCKFEYSAGDVDRIVGVTGQVLERIAGLKTELAESSRLSRIGFYLSGWHCSVDDKVYSPEYSYLMPDEDVVFTAVWEPKTYTLVFRPELHAEDYFIKIDAKTDTTVICPDINMQKPGYKFGGWDYKGTIYQPGDEFLVYGEIAGLGIPLEGVWIADNEPNPSALVYGDANCDGNVTLSDAILIMQSIGNPDAYAAGGSDASALTKQGMINADCYSPGDGVTNLDALAVQNLCLNVIQKLPVTEISE